MSLTIVGDAGGGAVGAVGGAEGVVHIDVGQAGQLLAERGLRFLVSSLRKRVFCEQHHVAVVHGGDSGLGVFADHLVVIGKDDRLAQQFSDRRTAHGGQAELGLGAVLRLAQVAAQDDLAAVGDQLLDGGQGRDDAVVVGDDAVLHGDVEVAADEHALAGVILIVNGLFTQSHSKSLLSVCFTTCFMPGPEAPIGPDSIIRTKVSFRKTFIDTYLTFL